MAVYDLVYRRIDGPRKPPELPALAIARADLRVLRKRKSIRGAFIALGIFTLLTTGYVVLRAGILNDYLPNGLPLASMPPVDARFFAKIYDSGAYHLLLVLLAVFAGAGRIAEDLRTNALALYLAKPLTREDYMAGKVGAVAAVVALGALGSPLLAYFVAALVDSSFLGQNLRTGAAILVLGVVTTAYHTSAILFFSAIARSGRVAGLLFAGLYFMSGILRESSRLALGSNATSFLGYAANLQTLGRHLFPVAASAGPVVDPGPLVPSLLAIAAVTVLGLFFARQRVRAVEVV